MRYAMSHELDRISEVLMTPTRADETGFNVRLPGLDLATLIQMASTQRQRLIVRVQSDNQEGYLYFAGGKVVHALAEGVTGELAVRRMLHWAGGDFRVCEQPWPAQPTIHASVEAILLRAAQTSDEDAHHVRDAPPDNVLPLRDAQLGEPNTRAATGPRAVPMRRTLTPPPPAKVPPPPPASSATTRDQGVIASVRIREDGEVIAAEGDAEPLSQLVAYTIRLATLAGAQLGLGPLDALYADLGEHRVVVFNDDGDSVGLVLAPSVAINDLRKTLGV